MINNFYYGQDINSANRERSNAPKYSLTAIRDRGHFDVKYFTSYKKAYAEMLRQFAEALGVTVECVQAFYAQGGKNDKETGIIDRRAWLSLPRGSCCDWYIADVAASVEDEGRTKAQPNRNRAGRKDIPQGCGGTKGRRTHQESQITIEMDGRTGHKTYEFDLRKNRTTIKDEHGNTIVKDMTKKEMEDFVNDSFTNGSCSVSLSGVDIMGGAKPGNTKIGSIGSIKNGSSFFRFS